jgi:hypothetical protein
MPRQWRVLARACKQLEVHSVYFVILASNGDFNRTEYQVTTQMSAKGKGPSDQFENQAVFLDETSSVIEAHERRARGVQTPIERRSVGKCMNAYGTLQLFERQYYPGSIGQ